MADSARLFDSRLATGAALAQARRDRDRSARQPCPRRPWQKSLTGHGAIGSRHPRPGLRPSDSGCLRLTLAPGGRAPGLLGCVGPRVQRRAPLADAADSASSVNGLGPAPDTVASRPCARRSTEQRPSPPLGCAYRSPSARDRRRRDRPGAGAERSPRARRDNGAMTNRSRKAGPRRPRDWHDHWQPVPRSRPDQPEQRRCDAAASFAGCTQAQFTSAVTG